MIAPETALIAVRAVMFVTAAAVFGGGAFALLLAREPLTAWLAQRLERWLVRSATTLLIATVAWLAIEAAVVTESWTAAHDPTTVWSLAVNTQLGRAGLLRITLALLSLLAARNGLMKPWPLTLAAGLFIASFALTGHAAAHEGAFGAVYALADAVHALAGCGWLGAIPPLIVTSQALTDARLTSSATAAFAGFAVPGAIAVSLVVATGVFNAWAILGESGLTASAYQVLLAGKIACVAGMLALALLNRVVLVPRIERGEDDAINALRASMTAEAMLGTLALVLVAIFATLEPA